MSTLLSHPEKCPENPKLQAFVKWWAVYGPFPIKIIFGDRTEEEQRKLYAQGRTVPGKIITNARSAAESAHGHSGAIDVLPVRAFYPAGTVMQVYTGDEPDPTVRAEALQLMNAVADLAERHGLESGRSFPGLHDLDHVQDPDWKSRPLNPRSTQ